MAVPNKDQNKVVTPPIDEYDPFLPHPNAKADNVETKEAEPAAQTGKSAKTTTGRRGATGRALPTPKPKALKSDARFLGEDAFEDTQRKNFSTKIYPELEAKIQGIVTLAKMSGQPRGMTSVVAVIQEAVSRYVETIEKEDGLSIPKMHGR